MTVWDKQITATTTLVLLLDFFKQASLKHRLFFFFLIIKCSLTGYSRKKNWITSSVWHTRTLWENDWELSNPEPIPSVHNKKKRAPAIYSTIKEQSCSWMELSGCVERRKAELVSICTRTTCWVTRSPASVKSSRLLLWLTLPATTSTLHHDLFHDSETLGL